MKREKYRAKNGSLRNTSGPGELLGFWGSMVFRHALIPWKGSGNNNRTAHSLFPPIGTLYTGFAVFSVFLCIVYKIFCQTEGFSSFLYGFHVSF